MAKAPKGTPFRKHYLNGELVIHPIVEKWLREELLPKYNLSWDDWTHYVSECRRTDENYNKSGIPYFKSFNTNPEKFGKKHIDDLYRRIDLHVECCAENKRLRDRREFLWSIVKVT